MKLSEILSKPFKVKGGGIVNLKGLSKHIVDKEIGGGGGDSVYNGFVSVLFNRVQTNILPHPTKFIDGSTMEIIDINDIVDGGNYNFLYKKSDIGSGIPMGYYLFVYLAQSHDTRFYAKTDVQPSSSSYIIDGEEYVYLTNEGPA